MRTHRWIPTLAVLSALSLAACDTGAESDAAGRSVSGSESAQEHGTAVNDTTPHRPGSPSTP